MTQAHRQTIKMLVEVRDKVRRELGLDPAISEPRILGQQLSRAFPGSNFNLAELKAELKKIANTPFHVWRILMSTAARTSNEMFSRKES